MALLADLPRRTRQEFQSLVDLSEAPPLFDFLLSTLEQSGLKQGKGSSAGPLLDTGVAIQAMVNPAVLTPEQAMRLAEAAIKSDPLFDARLLERAAESSPAGLLTAPEDELLRILDLVAGISDGRHVLWPLMKLTRHTSNRVRSKAVKLLGTLVQNPNWIEHVANDPDPRVRANLLEALSCPAVVAAPSIVDAVRRRAAQDPHHRVAVTALLGLCRAGDQASCHRLQELLNHPDPAWQAAARWAVGVIQSDEQAPAGQIQPDKGGDGRSSPREPSNIAVF